MLMFVSPVDYDTGHVANLGSDVTFLPALNSDCCFNELWHVEEEINCSAHVFH